jgi:NAD(P)-dependent dehydrogenase (short-subunit alcohol dehydrogenase family)
LEKTVKKVAIITGASAGLGLTTSIVLAKHGYRVYATMRNLERKAALLQEAETAQVAIHLQQLDVSSPASVQQAIETIIAKEGRIDILINNAGAGFAKGIEQVSEADMQWLTDLNYFGVVRCCKAVLPHMRQQKSGHIINITSVGGLVGQPFSELYCASKFAVEGFTESLAIILPKFGIHISLIEPGRLDTGLAKSAAMSTLDNSWLLDENDEYALLFRRYLARFKKRGQSKADAAISQQSPQAVAEVILAVINQDDPPLRVRTSEWAEDLCRFKTAADPNGKQQLADVIKRYLL